MSIRHQVPNHLIDLFLTEHKDTFPANDLLIEEAGDFYTTVEFPAESQDDEASVLLFITTFDKLYN